VLVVIDNPSSLLVMHLIPVPFIMGMHLPFWEYSEDDRIPFNPLPVRPYQGPSR
jgi:hypothetical protein